MDLLQKIFSICRVRLDGGCFDRTGTGDMELASFQELEHELLCSLHQRGLRGILIHTRNIGRSQGRQYSTEKTSNNSIASDYADGQ